MHTCTQWHAHRHTLISFLSHICVTRNQRWLMKRFIINKWKVGLQKQIPLRVQSSRYQSNMLWIVLIRSLHCFGVKNHDSFLLSTQGDINQTGLFIVKMYLFLRSSVYHISFLLSFLIPRFQVESVWADVRIYMTSQWLDPSRWEHIVVGCPPVPTIFQTCRGFSQIWVKCSPFLK